LAKQVWICLVDVVPMTGNEVLGGAAGALVHFLAPARGSDDLRQQATELFACEGFNVVGLSDAEPFTDRLRHGHAAPRIARLAERVLASQQPAYDDQWNLYERDDE
jgi:hypothetical protein